MIEMKAKHRARAWTSLIAALFLCVSASTAVSAAAKKAPPKPPKASKAFCAAIKRWQGVEIAFIASSNSAYFGWILQVRSASRDAEKATSSQMVRTAVHSVAWNSMYSKLALQDIQDGVDTSDSEALKRGILRAELEAEKQLGTDAQAQGRILNSYVIAACKFDMFGPIAAAVGGAGPVLDANDVPINSIPRDPTNTLVPPGP